MSRYITKRTVLIVVFVLVLLFGLTFVAWQYLAPPPETRDITISYSYETADSVTSMYGDEVQSDSGRDFLTVEMTIKNNGYDRFNTNPYWFSVTVGDIEYRFDYHLVLMKNWETTDVLDGETFQGTIVFQIPESAESFTLGYDDESDLAEYKIVWNEI